MFRQKIVEPICCRFMVNMYIHNICIYIHNIYIFLILSNLAQYMVDAYNIRWNLKLNHHACANCHHFLRLDCNV